MKEEFTINKPHIANDFTQLFFNFAREENSGKDTVYSIRDKDIKSILIRLGTMIQEREKSNFEQYTMFYENLLRQQHQLLFKREREIVSLKNTIEVKSAEVNVEVQCQMADLTYDLVMGNL
jgi:hypothetical protein